MPTTTEAEPNPRATRVASPRAWPAGLLFCLAEGCEKFLAEHGTDACGPYLVMASGARLRPHGCVELECPRCGQVRVFAAGKAKGKPPPLTSPIALNPKLA